MASRLCKAASLALFSLQQAAAEDFPNPGNRDELSAGRTPTNNVNVILATQAYNTDQNTMQFSYFITQDEFGNTTFFSQLKTQLEISISGSTVYQTMGFQDPTNGGQWDWMVCKVDYDGAANANANSRYWTIEDRYSKDNLKEQTISSLQIDAKQDWKFLGEGVNFTKCPPLEKCTFQCSGSRIYTTEDDKDYQFFTGATKAFFYYGIYVGNDQLIRGYSEFDNFYFPLAGGASSTAAAIALTALLTTASLF